MRGAIMRGVWTRRVPRTAVQARGVSGAAAWRAWSSTYQVPTISAGSSRLAAVLVSGASSVRPRRTCQRYSRGAWPAAGTAVQVTGWSRKVKVCPSSVTSGRV